MKAIELKQKKKNVRHYKQFGEFIKKQETVKSEYSSI